MLKDKVDVLIELEDADFMRLALEAHEKDITLNQHVNDIIKKYIDIFESPADE